MQKKKKKSPMKRNDNIGFWIVNTSAGERQKNRLGECMWLEVC